MAGKDYYKILGISREATEAEIKQAYRSLARKHHPDLNPGNKGAEAIFKEINEAYEVISDTEKRKKYNEYGDQWQHADQIAQARAQQRQQPQWQQYESGGEPSQFGGGGDSGNIFDDLFREFGSRGSTRNRARQGQDAEYPIEITLEEAYKGTNRILTMQTEDDCPGCGGTGRIQNLPCSVCHGAGRVPREKRLEVKIPAGVTNGSRIRFAGQGGHGSHGGPNGDLYLVVNVRPHAVFERKDDDLFVTLDVPVLTAVLGGEMRVPTMTGSVMLKVPPETQNGKVFNLKGKGMPRMGDSVFGDLLAKLNAVLPSHLSPEQKNLFEQLRKLGGGEA